MSRLNVLGMYSTDDWDGSDLLGEEYRFLLSDEMRELEFERMRDSHHNVEYCLRSENTEGMIAQNASQFVAEFRQHEIDELIDGMSEIDRIVNGVDLLEEE